MPNQNIAVGEIYRTERNEVFKLLERTGETLPTSKPWAIARWRVSFKDTYGKYHDNDEYFRWIEEIDVTENTNVAEPIPGLDWFEVEMKRAEEEKARKEAEKEEARIEKARLAEEARVISGTSLTKGQLNEALAGLSTQVITESRHRGRPVVAMNELKAKNLVREYKQGKREDSDDEVIEAYTFLDDNGFKDYLNKHFTRG